MLSKVFSLQVSLAIGFLVAFVLITAIIHHRLDEYAIGEAEAQAQHFLLAYKSVRSLVREWHKPEIYRLQENNELSQDYFSPALLSTTFNARGFVGFLNQNLQGTEFPTLRFKLASDNPRNPLNQANARELQILKGMRKGEITSLKEIITLDDNEYFSYSVPTDPVEERCLRCHGKPENAPQKLIELYGDKNGFNSTVGEIRALLNLTIPIKLYYQKGHALLLKIALGLAGVLLILYYLIRFFISKLEKQKKIISEQADELTKLSRCDKLTGIFNRLGFEESANQIMSQSFRYKDPLSLIIFDIDHFKNVNDTYGHVFGDVVLKNVALVARQTIRQSDVVCRWGGEEFVILSPMTHLDDAAILAERIRLALEQFDHQDGEISLRITASFGVVTVEHEDSLDKIIQPADEALYRAKKNGRNRVEVGFHD